MTISIQSLVVLGCVFLMPLFAGANDEINLKQAVVSLKMEKKTLIQESIQLTVKESEAFWPIYDRYQEALKKVARRTLNFVRNYAKEKETMTDKQAKEMMKEFLSIQEERLKLKKSFIKEFNVVLPPKKLMRYFQLENKIEAGINYELASHIPLIK
jgi:hypothetical protein